MAIPHIPKDELRQAQADDIDPDATRPMEPQPAEDRADTSSDCRENVPETRFTSGGSGSNDPRKAVASAPNLEPTTLVHDPLGIPASPAASLLLPLQVGRYLLTEEIAHGGMGAILRARDEQFHRTLAIKVLLARHDKGSLIARRFVEEAQIVGQLQHPGIPPVHERGELPDGRPYFSMKLIKGRTLAAMLDDRAEPAESLPWLLDVFEQICQTVAYAHSRGILHRDLKPANVMVGAFGEVQVMDWGLAKVLGEQEPLPTEHGADALSEIVALRAEDGSDVTRVGTFIGTPAYVAPEQARGEIDQLDERCDVFGLGAILCEVLTGRPPFLGSTPSEIHAKAARGDVADAFARLDRSADQELVDLATRCLAPEKANRPKDALAVAKAVADYQAAAQQKLQQERLERERQKVKAAEERKRRKLILLWSASFLLVVLLGAGGGLLYQRHVSKRELGLQKEVADGELRLAKEEGDRKARLVRLRQGIDADVRLAATFMDRWRWSEAEQLLRQAQDRLGANDSSELHRSVQRASDDLKWARHLDEIRMKRSTGDDGKYFDVERASESYRRALKESGMGAVEDKPEEVAVRLRKSSIREHWIGALDDWAFAVKDKNRRAWILEVARRADVETAGFEQRNALRDPKAWEDFRLLEKRILESDFSKLSPRLITAVAWHLRFQGLKPFAVLQKAHWQYPNDYWINFALASEHGLQSLHPDASIAHYLAAIALRPDSAPAFGNLGSAYEGSGQSKLALEAYRQAVKIDPRYALGHVGIGNVYYAMRELDKSFAAYEQGLEIDPQNVDVYFNLAGICYERGELDRAVSFAEQAVKIAPDNVKAYLSLADFLATKKEFDRAREVEQQAVRAFNQMLQKNPNDTKAYHSLAFLHSRQGNKDKAIENLKEVIRIKPKDAVAHNNLGAAYKASGEIAKAIKAHNEAIKLRPDLAGAWRDLGYARQANQQTEEAIEAYKKAIGLNPKDFAAYHALSRAYTAVGKSHEALKACEQAFESSIRSPQDYADFANGLLLLGRFAEARDAMQKCVQMVSEKHPHRNHYEQELKKCDTYTQADEMLSLVMRGEKKLDQPDAQLALARFCRKYKRNYLVAARLYRDAFRQRPQLADNRFASDRYHAAQSAVLAAAGTGVGGDVLFAEERARWREQARQWLQDDLQAWRADKSTTTPAGRAYAKRILNDWQTDADLASVRGQKALEKLPEEERKAWQELWEDHRKLLQQLASE